MGLNSLSSLSYVNNLFSLNNDGIKPIDIPVTSGEFLTLEQLAQKIVMKALETNEPAKADEFIKQSGFKLDDKEISRKSENGNFFYRFEPTEKFQKSIENFQMKGQALLLQEFNVDVSVGELKPIPPVKSSKAKQNTAQDQTRPNRIEDPRNQSKEPRNTFDEETGTKTPLSRYDVKRGFDNKRVSVPLSYEDLIAVRNSTKDGDSRLELYTQALKTLGYSEQAIKNVLANEGITTDENSKVNLPGNTDNEKKDIKDWLNQKIEEWKDSNNPNSVNYGKTPRSRFVLDAGLRQKIYIEDFKVKGDKAGLDRFQLQLKLSDEIRHVNDKFKDIPIDNNLQKAFLELNRQTQIKDAIDRVYAESGIDFRSNQTEAQKGANETADTIEKAIRFGLDTDPKTSWMPETLKNRIVNAGIGVYNGGAYLAAAGSGVNNFFEDKAIDAISYGLNKLGYDTKDFDNAQTAHRQKRAEMWQAYTNLQTANLSKLDTALQEKIKRNLPIGGMDIPSLERSIGSVLPQAAVQGGIAVATGGASIPIQIAVTASVNGGMAFGATYSQTNDTWKAGEEAIWTAGQTAMIPLSSKLPGVANTSFDLATGYVVGKMRGQSDSQILDSMLTQGLLGAGFKAGSKLADLSPAMQKQARDTFKIVADESQKAVDGIYKKAKEKYNAVNAKVNELQVQTSQLKARIQSNIRVTEGDVVQARAIIRNHARNTPLYGLYIGGADPKLANAYRKIAQAKIQDGLTNFKDFSNAMIETAGTKVTPFLTRLYGEFANKETIKVNQKEIDVLNLRESDLRAKFAKIEEFRRENDLPEFSYPKNAKGEATGTVAYIDADGKQAFGTNTTIGREKLGTDNLDLRKGAITDIQDKLGKLVGAKYGDKDTKFLTHAEAEALLKLAKENGGKLPKELTMYVDRPSCFIDCRGKDLPGKGLGLLVELYGMEKLTVFDSYGTKYVFRPNEAVEVIK